MVQRVYDFYPNDIVVSKTGEYKGKVGRISESFSPDAVHPDFIFRVGFSQRFYSPYSEKVDIEDRHLDVLAKNLELFVPEVQLIRKLVPGDPIVIREPLNVFYSSLDVKHEGKILIVDKIQPSKYDGEVYIHTTNGSYWIFANINNLKTNLELIKKYGQLNLLPSLPNMPSI